MQILCHIKIIYIIFEKYYINYIIILSNGKLILIFKQKYYIKILKDNNNLNFLTKINE
jgi:hypothetical protein